MEVQAADPAYLPRGRFEVERMLVHLHDAEVSVRAEGYASLSIVGEMSWVLSEPPGRQHVGEYERRATTDLRETQAIGLGQYDRARFEPWALRRIAARTQSTSRRSSPPSVARVRSAPHALARSARSGSQVSLTAPVLAPSPTSSTRVSTVRCSSPPPMPAGSACYAVIYIRP
jgi:hypothetical protein